MDLFSLSLFFSPNSSSYILGLNGVITLPSKKLIHRNKDDYPLHKNQLGQEEMPLTISQLIISLAQKPLAFLSLFHLKLFMTSSKFNRLKFISK